MFCPKCGANVEKAGAAFCPRCGSKLSAAGTASGGGWSTAGNLDGSPSEAPATRSAPAAGTGYSAPTRPAAPAGTGYSAPARPAASAAAPVRPAAPAAAAPVYAAPAGYAEPPKKSGNKALKIALPIAIGVTLLIVLGIILFFVLRGGGNNVAGTYKIESAMGMDRDELEGYMHLAGVSGDLDDYFSMKLKSDGTGTIIVDGEVFEVDWELDDDEISLTVDGDTVVGSYEDGEITIKESGISMTFAK